MTSRLQNRRDTAANWTSNNPTLAAGEIGYETDTAKFKIGDGTTAWSSLAYAYTAGAAGATGPTGPSGATGATGPSGAGLTANGLLTAPMEAMSVVASAPTGTINFDVKTQGILYWTSNATANFTLNFRGDSSTTLNTVMSNNQAITVSFMFPNDGTRTGSGGAYPYYPSAITIDGTSITPKYYNSIAFIGGTASAINVFTYTIIKTAANTYTVLATQNAWN